MPFVKGQSGNPAGRPPKATARKELEALLDKTWTVAQREQALINLAAMAEARDLDALKLLLAYTYGKPVDRKEITGADGASIGVSFVDYRTDLPGLSTGSDEDSPASG